MKISLGGTDQQHNCGSSALSLLSVFGCIHYVAPRGEAGPACTPEQHPESPHITPHHPVPPTLVTAHHPCPPASPPPATPRTSDTRAAFLCILNIYRTTAGGRDGSNLAFFGRNTNPSTEQDKQEQTQRSSGAEEREVGWFLMVPLSWELWGFISN